VRIPIFAVYCSGFASSYFSGNLLQNKGELLVPLDAIPAAVGGWT